MLDHRDNHFLMFHVKHFRLHSAIFAFQVMLFLKYVINIRISGYSI
jgi:hypothetical protein